MAFAVSTVFRAFDKVSPAFKRMSKGARAFGVAAESAFARASRRAKRFKGIASGFVKAQLFIGGLNKARQALGALGQEYLNFDHAVTVSAAKFPDLADKIGKIPLRATETFKQLQNAARQVGAETKFTAAEAAEGLNFLAMAGFNAEQSMGLLPKTTELATVANVELGRATDIATDSLGAFNLMSKDSEQLTKNLTRVNDVFAKTIVSTNTDLEQLFESVKFAGPVATSTGAQIEEVAAQTGLLANAGIKGTLAGTTLKNMYLRLAAPVGKAETLLKKLKIQTADSSGNMLGMADIIQQLEKRLMGMGTQQRAAALDTIFGKRAIAGANVLMNAGAKRIRIMTKRLKESQGAAKDMAKEIGSSLENRLKKLRSALIETGFKILDAFAGKAPGAVDTLIEKIKKVDVQPIVEGLKKVISFAKWLAENIDTITFAVKGLISVWAGFKIAAAITALKEFAVAAKAAALAGGALTGGAVPGGVPGKGGKTPPVAPVPGAVPALPRLAQIMIRLGKLGIIGTATLQGDTAGINEQLWNMRKETEKNLMRTGDQLQKAFKKGDKEEIKRLTDQQKKNHEAIGMLNKALREKGIKFEGRTGRDLLTDRKVKKPLAERLGLEESDARKELEEARKFMTSNILGKKQMTVEEEEGTTFAKLTGFEAPKPPNAAQEEAKKQEIEFTANINLGGAPPGTTVESETKGAPPARVNLAGGQ